MAARQFLVPGNHATVRGLAEPGATASLYTTNTTTPQPFYSDAALSVSLGASITANGAGNFPIAYQDSDTAFRLILKDRNGAELDGGDIDPFYFGQSVFQVNAPAITPTLFGFSESNTGAQNSDAIEEMLAYLKDNAVNVETNYQGLERVLFPAGDFDVARTIELTDGSVIIEGQDVARPAGHGTKLNFPAGVTGIRVHAYNTSGATGPADSPTHRGGQATIRNLALVGAYVATEAEAHGIQLRGQANIENVFIDLFQGDGIYSFTSVGDGTNEGNANVSFIKGCRIQRCRNGLFFDGADTNVISVIACDFSSNRMWGVWDSGFIGNTYVACHSATNGWVEDAKPTGCVLSGNRYFVQPGQATGASTNSPSGTTADNTWWGYTAAGGVYPGVVAWVSGTTFREGGAYKTDSANGSHVFIGCYDEGDQNPGQVVAPSNVNGGTLALSNRGTALKVVSDNGGAPVFGFRRGARDSTVEIANSLNSSIILLTRYTAGGATQNIDGKIWTASGQLIIDHSAGVKIGFRLGQAEKMAFTTSGLLISAAGYGLGWSTGAGGAQTQGTSKSTAVTLDKACGQITMHNASLADNAKVSFALNNSLIATTDVLNVTIGGGAADPAAYAVRAAITGAGTAKITLKNDASGGALGEAVVLNCVLFKGVAA